MMQKAKKRKRHAKRSRGRATGVPQDRLKASTAFLQLSYNRNWRRGTKQRCRSPVFAPNARVECSTEGTNAQQLAAFIALSRNLSRIFPLRGAGRKILAGQLLIVRS